MEEEEQNDETRKRRSSRSRRSSRRKSFSLQTIDHENEEEQKQDNNNNNNNNNKSRRSSRSSSSRRSSRSGSISKASTNDNDTTNTTTLNQQLLPGDNNDNNINTFNDNNEYQNLNTEDLNCFQKCLLYTKYRWNIFSKYKKFMLYNMLIIAILCFFIFSNLMLTSVTGYTKKPQVMPCYAKAWFGKSACGVDGEYCKPFKTDTWQPVRCPGRCAFQGLSKVSNIIGSGPYRSDSWLCQAAIHRGVLSDRGGCALYKMTGYSIKFDASTKNGVISNGSAFWFPSTFDIKKVEGSSFCFDETFNFLMMFIMFSHCTWMYFMFPYYTNVKWRYIMSVFYGMLYLGLVDQRLNKNFEYKLNRALNEVVVLLPILYIMYLINKDFAFNIDGQKMNHNNNLNGQYEEMTILDDNDNNDNNINIELNNISINGIGNDGDDNDKISLIRWRAKYIYFPFLQLLPFWLGINIHLFVYFVPDFSITPDIVKLCQPFSFSCIRFIILISFIFIVVIFFVYAHYVEKTLKQRLCLYFVILLLFVFFQMFLGNGYRFHLHHSFLGFILYLGVGLKRRSLVSLFFASFLLGLVINGVMNWGWDGSLWDHVGVPFSGDGGGGGGSSSSSGHSSHHRIEVPELTNSSLTSTSVNIIWQNNYTFAKNVRLYMNDVMIYQDIVKPSVNSFAVKDLLPNGVKYFFQMEYTSFNINLVLLKSKKLFITTLNGG